MISAELRPLVEKYLNAVAELFQEVGQLTGDALIATRTSEACVRSRMRTAEGSTINREMVIGTPPDAAGAPSRVGSSAMSDRSFQVDADDEAVGDDESEEAPPRATRDWPRRWLVIDPCCLDEAIDYEPGM